MSRSLNLQHYIWLEVFGYNVYPKIVDPGYEKWMKIADVGTGTAIWLLQFSDQLPEAEFVGFDYSTAQYPDDRILPSNVKLETWDVKISPPEQYEGFFDVVHVRSVSFRIIFHISGSS